MLPRFRSSSARRNRQAGSGNLQRRAASGRRRLTLQSLESRQLLAVGLGGIAQPDVLEVVPGRELSGEQLPDGKPAGGLPDSGADFGFGRLAGARLPGGGLFPSSGYSPQNGPNIRVVETSILRDGDGSLVESIPAGQMISIQVTFVTENVPNGSQFDIVFVADGVALYLRNIRWAVGSDTYYATMSGWYADANETQLAALLDAEGEIAEVDESDNLISQAFLPSDPRESLAPLVLPVDNQREFPLTHARYADVDPRGGDAEDFAGGGFALDGEHGWEIAAADFRFQDHGIPIRAAAAGVVTEVFDGVFDRETFRFGDSPGNYVIIDHGNGWESHYRHAARDSILVEVGQQVAAGEWIADFGSSGDSDAPNVHFELRRLGMPVEPLLLPESYFVDPAQFPYQGDLPVELTVSAFSRFGGDSLWVHEGAPQEDVLDISTLPPTTLAHRFRLSHILEGDEVEVDVYGPGGTLVEEFGETAEETVPRPYFSFPIGSDKWYFVGTYNVDISVNGQLIETETFEVTSEPLPPRIFMSLIPFPMPSGRTTPIAPTLDSSFVVRLGTRNMGSVPLEIGTPEVPMGWSVEEYPATVPPGERRFIVLRVDETFDSKNMGAVRVPTNDPAQPVYTFNVEKVAAEQDNPLEVLLPGPDVAYRVGGGARPFDAHAEFVSLFSSIGELHVIWEGGRQAGDRLNLLSSGDGAGEVRVDGSQVFYEGTLVGTLSSGGLAPDPLVIDFENGVSNQAASAVMRAITFDTTSETLRPRFLRAYAIDQFGEMSTHAYKSVRVQPPASDLPAISDVQLPGLELSRSRVGQLEVTFDSEVTILPGAFELLRRDSGELVDLEVTSDHSAGQTIAMLAFSGDLTESGSLIDGNYQLRIRGSHVLGPGGALDGDADGAAGGDYLFGDDPEDAFFRFYGDIDGDREVDFIDFLSFRSAYGSDEGDSAFRSDLDFDADASIGFLDFLELRGRYGEELPFV